MGLVAVTIFAFLLILKESFAALPPPRCLYERNKVEQEIKRGLQDAFLPTCESDGHRFTLIQRYGLLGTRWCVNPITGERIEGTTRKRGEPDPECLIKLTPIEEQKRVDPPVTVVKPIEPVKPTQSSGAPCKQEYTRIMDEIKRNRISDMPTPSCTDEGFWKVEQYSSPMMRTPWYCADPRTGKSIPGTHAASKPNCGACHKKLEGLLTQTPKLGSAVPQCDDKGWFVPKQVDGSTGHSYCVDKQTGKLTSAPQREWESGPLNCDQQLPVIHILPVEPTKGNNDNGPCQQEYDKIMFEIKNRHLADASPPSCTKEGYWTVVQRGGFAGSMQYCVDPRTGKSVPGSSKPFKDGLPDCGACYKHLEGLLTRQPMHGRYLPQCDAKGLYLPKQGNTSGYSFCVNPITGKQITEPKRELGNERVNCDAVKPKKKCKPKVKPIPIIALKDHHLIPA